MDSAGDQNTQNPLQDAVPVFWSGGVESTFRVLDLVIRHGYPVQPVYVIHINEGRRNHNLELVAMDRIRSGLAVKFPQLATMLRQTIVLPLDELELTDEIIRQGHQMGPLIPADSQFLWMSAAVNKLGIGRIEMGIKRQLQALWYSQQIIQDHMVPYTWPVGAQSHELTNWIPETEVQEGLLLMRQFTYPIIYTPIEEINRIAREYDFADLMQNTWTCHRPMGNQPCGYCYVCSTAISDGKGMYFPKSALVRNKLSIAPKKIMHHARPPLSKVKQFLLRNMRAWQSR